MPVPKVDFMFGRGDGPDPVKCLPLPELFVYVYSCNKQDGFFGFFFCVERPGK